jgi:multiple sugar transport system ATP-binding protein
LTVAAIEFKGVTKRYRDGTEAVKSIDLEIPDGEFMILVGPSGCGKTTALRMIAGLEEISEGELYVGERLVNELPPGDRDIAMVFQNYALYPHMTVRQNIGFPLRMAGVKKAEIRQRVDEAAELLGLSPHLDRKPANLSGGQRQRVAMGRSIVRDPQAFLMDEPLSNLDAKLRTEMRAQIAQLQDRLGTTTVFVTHDQTEAMTLGDRLAVMRDGVIQQVGSPQTLYEEPTNLFVAGFIGSPQMNLLEARLEGDRIVLPFGDAQLPGELRDRLGDDASIQGTVLAGVRPEQIDAATTNGQVAQLTFKTRIELVESIGSELYLHFGTESNATESGAVMRDVSAEEQAQRADRVVARVDAAHRTRIGDLAELSIDLRRLALFDPKSGRCLTNSPTHAVGIPGDRPQALH